ncbi:uncharacterized protein LOC117096372 isoform X2 [Trachypithecus francoisi]|uniref:uncharacterized protein LOC117096372 isoform X2 n=1 Tax=Trachypithecus francoisi TaxID=54180 RepID=UPI00141BD309|nr:uncharacterized protein LOC117096372 isoform X2 [Trachypithecus francoisi]
MAPSSWTSASRTPPSLQPAPEAQLYKDLEDRTPQVTTEPPVAPPRQRPRVLWKDKFVAAAAPDSLPPLQQGGAARATHSMELAGALPLPSCKPATSAATQVVTADLSLLVVFQGKQIGALPEHPRLNQSKAEDGEAIGDWMTSCRGATLSAESWEVNRDLPAEWSHPLQGLRGLLSTEN